ncbi:MAG: hypothetical protein ISS16_12185 [Ignavibacteria bacterium]|nr:hypothetical protein [Ignavibacteria bacterium]
MEKIEFDQRREIILKDKEKYKQIGMSLYKLINDVSKGEKDFMFPLPNYTAIFLNISDINYKRAKELLNEKIFKLKKEKTEYYELDPKYEPLIYDYLEAVFTSIIFGHTAVECLVNSLIPNAILRIKKSESKLKLESKKFIERNISLKDKIKKILPKVYNYGFNANNLKFWNDFTKLLKYRDELIHLKSNEFEENRSVQIRFMNELLDDVYRFDVIESARELIEYLSKKIPTRPGFPKEFLKEEISYRGYFEHYRSKEIDLKKKLIIEFPNEKAFRDFFSQKHTNKEREFSVIIK